MKIRELSAEIPGRRVNNKMYKEHIGYMWAEREDRKCVGWRESFLAVPSLECTKRRTQVVIVMSLKGLIVPVKLKHWSSMSGKRHQSETSKNSAYIIDYFFSFSLGCERKNSSITTNTKQ